MERSLLFSVLSIGTFAAHAHLAPTADAPLREHLLEVNQEWRTMGTDLADAGRVVHFTSDAERIATHLFLVHDRLTADHSDLAPEAAAQRRALLMELQAYAGRGVFPINDVLPYRNPVFIDRIGTACAVGQLIITSGRCDIAASIQGTNNPAYIRELHRADVDAWAAEHGFSAAELAWIQPGYLPALPWVSLGGGTNGEVNALARAANGDLIVAGAFTEAGTVECNNAVRWQDTAFQSLGAPPEGNITCAIEFEGSVYLGGLFQGGFVDLVRWDENTSAWEPSTVFMGKFGMITALHVHDGRLHAAGLSSGFAGTSYGVKRLHDGAWEDVGQPLSAAVRALETFDGSLVCGGDFIGDVLDRVARLENDVWQPLGLGLDGNVYDLLVEDGMLYAGGDCVTEMAAYFGLARIAPGSNTWEELMPNIQNYIFSAADGLVHINALQAIDGRIYLGGDFDINQGLTMGHGLGVFNGTPDDVQPMGYFDGPVYDLDILGTNHLVVAGSFSTQANLAMLDLAAGVNDPAGAAAALQVWPNPATDRLTVALPTASGFTAELLDASGRVVLASAMRNTTNTIDVGALAQGTYTLRLLDGSGVRTARFVKH